MTPHERVEAFWRNHCGGLATLCDHHLEELIAETIADERAACAGYLERAAEHWRVVTPETLLHLSRVIRSGTSPAHDR